MSDIYSQLFNFASSILPARNRDSLNHGTEKVHVLVEAPEWWEQGGPGRTCTDMNMHEDYSASFLPFSGSVYSAVLLLRTESEAFYPFWCVCVLPRNCAMDGEQVLTSPTPYVTYRHLRSFNLDNENEREQNRGVTQPANQKKNDFTYSF